MRSDAKLEAARSGHGRAQVLSVQRRPRGVPSWSSLRCAAVRWALQGGYEAPGLPVRHVDGVLALAGSSLVCATVHYVSWSRAAWTVDGCGPASSEGKDGVSAGSSRRRRGRGPTWLQGLAACTGGDRPARAPKDPRHARGGRLRYMDYGRQATGDRRQADGRQASVRRQELDPPHGLEPRALLAPCSSPRTRCRKQSESARRHRDAPHAETLVAAAAASRVESSPSFCPFVLLLSVRGGQDALCCAVPSSLPCVSR